MKTQLIFILGLFAQITIFAQECTLKGALQNDSGIPVTDATVSLFNAQNEGVGFTYSDKEGLFQLSAPCAADYEIEIEHASHELHIEKVDLRSNQNLKIRLKQGESINLKEAIVNAKQAIKIKGDTIEYDADSFKVGNEEVLEDILKKLPGIVVENGKVYHNGKEITTITVGGREVLGGNTKLLNKNLPSDAVDKIQLNKKFKANPFASSLQEDEQFSLNIELKEDKKNLAFGNFTIGGNADEHADAQSKTFYFSKKTDATLIGDFNTYGKQVFDQEDYFSFFGGFSEFNSEGSIYSLRSANSTFFFLGSQEKAREMNTFTAATHAGFEVNPRLTVTGFGMLTGNNIRYKQLTERFYNLNKEQYERDNETNTQNVTSVMGRVRLDYSPTQKGQLKYRLNYNHTDSDLEQSLESYRNHDFYSNIKVKNLRKNSSISQNLSYIQKVGSDHNIGFYLRHQYQEEQPDLWINASNPILSTVYNTNFTDLKNIRKTRVNTLQFYTVYNHLLTNTANLKLKGGTNFSKQGMDITTFGNGNVVEGDYITGNTDFDYQQYYLDATLTKKIDKLQLDLGAGLHHIRYAIDYLTNEKRNDTKMLVHAQATYNISNAQNITLVYNQDYNYPSIIDLNPMYRLNNYYAIFYGNTALMPSKTHQSNLSYQYFNSFSFFSLYANLGYTVRENSIQTASVFENGFLDQQTTLINSPENEKTWNANLFISKRFSKTYNLRVNSNISHADYFTLIRLRDNQTLLDQLTNTTIFSQFYNLRNIFTIQKKVEITAGLKLMLNDYESTSKQSFKTWQPHLEFAWSLLDKWLILSDFNYLFQYRNGDLINEAKQLNASVRYNIAKKTTLTLIGGNLLGNDILYTNSFNDNYTQTTQKEVIGRYLLLNLRYKF
ncbi:TonB-dependent receptor [Vaginella massiliensis]|uniref:TonB-dependent receptor n=1 Tax=Vaginella massiliensis TaxID=1816680 RepID=UPI000838842A|nr:TonB-dependent receptor [Vaginella massiliensis]